MPDDEEVRQNVKLIENTLLEFDIDVNIVDVQVGPTVTRYMLQPHKADGSERIRMSRIASYSRDLSLALAAKRLRLETPVPGTNYMGIEVPNKQPGTVTLRNVMESEPFSRQRDRSDSPLLIPLGRDVAGGAGYGRPWANAASLDRRHDWLRQISLHGRDRDGAADAEPAESIAHDYAGPQNG